MDNYILEARFKQTATLLEKTVPVFVAALNHCYSQYRSKAGQSVRNRKSMIQELN